MSLTEQAERRSSAVSISGILNDESDVQPLVDEGCAQKSKSTSVLDIRDDNRVLKDDSESNTKVLAQHGSNTTSIGLQASATEIALKVMQSETSPATMATPSPASPSRTTLTTAGIERRYDSPVRKQSVPFGGSERKISLHDCHSICPDSSSRKTSLSLGADRKISLNDLSVGSVTCRICLDGDVMGEQLVNPCLCTGSASHVHIMCLKRWLMTSGNTVCELCQYELDVGWKATSIWKALKDLSRARMTNRKICWALLVSVAALTLPLFCICIFVLDDENLRLQLSRPASMALSYGVIIVSCVAYLALLFIVAYLTWKWDFCPNTARCHFPTEIEIRIESLEERIKRGRTRRSSYYRNATPILDDDDVYERTTRRSSDVMDSYWLTGGAYV